MDVGPTIVVDGVAYFPGRIRQIIRERHQLAQSRAERDLLAQAMWDAFEALGFDTDGDTDPRAWIAGAKSYERFASEWLAEVRQHRADHDALGDEWDEAERERRRLASELDLLRRTLVLRTAALNRVSETNEMLRAMGRPNP